MAEAANLPKAAARQGTKRRLPPASDASVVFEILDWCVVALTAALLLVAPQRPNLTYFLYASAGLGVLVAIAQAGDRRYFLPNFILWGCSATFALPFLLPQVPTEYTAALATASASLLLGSRFVSVLRRTIRRRKASAA